MRRVGTAVLLMVGLTGCPFFTSEESESPGQQPQVRGRAQVRVDTGATPRPAAPPSPTPAAQAAAPRPAPEPAAAANDSISARHILINFEGSTRSRSDRSKEAAHELITDLLRRARAGEDFAALAREHSEGPSGPRGGDLRSFTRGRMVPAFEQAAFALDVDAVSDVVETPFGFHIIQRYR